MKNQKQNLNSFGVLDSPVGKLGIVVEGHQVKKIDYLPAVSVSVMCKNPVVCKVVSQLRKYFKDPKSKFDLDLFFSGTKLQKKIWRQLLKIPLGKTMTYGDLAKKIGTSPRVVGNACRCNPIPVVVPCHRVVSANGLGGYCGSLSSDTITVKQWLLSHEGSEINI